MSTVQGWEPYDRINIKEVFFVPKSELLTIELMRRTRVPLTIINMIDVLKSVTLLYLCNRNVGVCVNSGNRSSNSL